MHGDARGSMGTPMGVLLSAADHFESAEGAHTAKKSGAMTLEPNSVFGTVFGHGHGYT